MTDVKDQRDLTVHLYAFEEAFFRISPAARRGIICVKPRFSPLAERKRLCNYISFYFHD